MPNKDPYEFETGLADDFDFECSNAYFAYNPKVVRDGEPQMLLHLEGKAEGGSFETPTMLEGETALLFGVGQKWMATEGGQKLVHESGAERTFNANAAVARLTASAVKAGAPLRDRGTPQEAGIWKGLRLHFKRIKVQFGGDIGERDVLAVSAYLGEAANGSAKKAAAAPAASAAAGTTKAPAGDDVTAIKDGVGGAIFKRLEKLAADSEDYDTWAADASALPKVTDDLQDIILDPERGQAVYEALRG